ncbi:aladin-like [Pollicipes pollicipes]|uniref:aladin-like n=1 Tax=Pollicipes pollicipes TaxID=41117 RepID=UPI0018849C70|nr:aladin-like [Pollicipes pollicipes]
MDRPHSSSLLAVACERCVLVWTVEPSSVITRPSGTCAQTLAAPGHAPVTSVRWSPLGDLLMSASPSDSALLLWSVAEESHVPLKRLWSAGHTLCRWSPDASRVFTATTGPTFRVWETGRWTDERWRCATAGGPVSAACWSPDGRVALFVTSAEPVVYSLSFMPVLLMESAPKPVPVIDLTARRLDHGKEMIHVGGEVSGLTWDSTGRRLAVSFVDSDAVAVFSTELHPHLRIAACGLIRGLKDEYPVAVEFQMNLQDTTSLCVAWSSGRIQHVPMLVPASAAGGLLESSALSASVAASPGRSLGDASLLRSPVQLFSVDSP